MPTIKELKQHISGLSEAEPVHYVLWFKEGVTEGINHPYLKARWPR